MIRPFLILAAFSITACGQSEVIGPAREPAQRPSPSEAPSATPIASAGGWGPVRVGMSRARASEAMGGAAEAPLLDKEVWGSCYAIRPVGAQGVEVTIENGRVVRVDIGPGAEVVTDSGLRLGDSADQVRQVYGAALETEVSEETGARFLTAWTPRINQGIRFRIGPGDTVEAIILGEQAIRRLQGCS